MPKFLPNDNRTITQPNNGDVFGNLWATFNIDLETNRGRIRASSNDKKAINQTDLASFDGYAAQFAEFNSSVWAISDVVVRTTNESDPRTGWALDADTNSPTPGNTVTDMCVFDGMLLAVDGNDIDRNPGDGDWDSWWVGLRGQSALSTGQRFFIKVGPTGYLYIVNGGNKVYSVEPNGSGTGTVDVAGNGTLDFSEQPYKITCMEFTSTRMWLGFEHTAGGEGGVIEWDMGLQTNTPNRIHKLGTKAVRAIAIWNDTPIPVLSNGDVRVYNGASFETWPAVQFPSANLNIELEPSFIHPNGWAIIDNLPHFLVAGSDIKETSGFDSAINSPINFPAGVWCLDPEIGLYNRFSVSAGASTQSDYGHMSINAPGALYAVENGYTKFLASFTYYNGTGTASTATITYEDTTRTNPTRSWLISTPLEGPAVFKEVEALHKKLSSGDEIRLYYRHQRTDSVVLQGTWSTTTTFHTTDDASNVQKGDLLMVKTGKGAGVLLKIKNIDTSALTTVITLEEASPFVTEGDDAGVECINFRFMGKIDNTVKDIEAFNIPSAARQSRLQLLVEIRQAASSTVEIDSLDINVA